MAVAAIGALSGGLGIIQFGIDNFPKAEEDLGAAVRIKAGLGDMFSKDMGGKITSIYGFDVHNDYLGNSKSGSVSTGDKIDLTIAQAHDGRQAQYVSVANGKDATCIAWITVSQHDGSDGGAWTGDVGFNCGQPWYFSNQTAGKLPDGKTDYQPRCTWLDADGSNGIPSASLKFNVGAYGSNVKDTVANDLQCSSTIFSAATGPISDMPAGQNTKRSSHHRNRPACTETRLVISTHVEQTAEALCNHPNSVGPDFVGSEGYFCDMVAKALSPLCSTHQQDGCIQVTTNGTLTKRTSVARRSVDLVHKSYTTVDHWG